MKHSLEFAVKSQVVLKMSQDLEGERLSESVIEHLMSKFFSDKGVTAAMIAAGNYDGKIVNCCHCGSCFYCTQGDRQFETVLRGRRLDKTLIGSGNVVNIVVPLSAHAKAGHSGIVKSAKERTQRMRGTGRPACALRMHRAFWASWIDLNEFRNVSREEMLSIGIHIPSVTFDWHHGADARYKFVEAGFGFDTAFWRVTGGFKMNEPVNLQANYVLEPGVYKYQLYYVFDREGNAYLPSLYSVTQPGHCDVYPSGLPMFMSAAEVKEQRRAGTHKCARVYRSFNSYSNDVNEYVVSLLDMFISKMYTLSKTNVHPLEISFHYNVEVKYIHESVIVTSDPHVYLHRLNHRSSYKDRLLS